MEEDVWVFKANRSRGIVPGIRTIDATMYRVIPSMVAFLFFAECLDGITPVSFQLHESIPSGINHLIHLRSLRIV